MDAIGKMTAVAMLWLTCSIAPAAGAELPSAIGDRLREVETDAPIKAWVLLQPDKGYRSQAELEAALQDRMRTYDAHAVQRRTQRRSRPGLFDVDDLPLPESWLEQVRATGARIVIQSRWAAAVSVLANEAQLHELAELAIVRGIRPVLRGARRNVGLTPDFDAAIPTGDPFYGETLEQLEQMNLTALHASGLTGLGMRIGVLDTGFRTTHAAFNAPGHPLNVVAEWDFVNDDPVTAPEPGDLPTQHDHGTWILGTMAAYRPGLLVGAAYDASYILAKVEDLTAEYPAEEDMFVAGLEFIEANGGDVATSSVVIFNFYTQDDLDGETTVMSQGLNVAAANGLHVCQGAGNDGHDSDPRTSSLVPPADAFRTITVGAVSSSGSIAGFSSDGPTADGRLKPEILARGVNTRTVSSTDDVTTTGVNGTSLSTPLLAGASACLLQAHPDWSVDQLRAHLFLNADLYQAQGAPDPLFVHGFGIIDALAASEEDCNDNGAEDSLDLENGTSGDCNGNALPDECDVAALVSPDDALDGLPDECTECQTGPGCPEEVGGLLLAKQFPDLVLSWQLSSSAVAYSVLRDPTAQSAGTTTVGQTAGPELDWTETDGLTGAAPMSFYLVRGVSGGGVLGP